MATVIGDDQGVLETCDDMTASCDDCDWDADGDGVTVIAEAEEHVDATGHRVSLTGMYMGSVEP
jgi:hypothetical protein